MKLASEKIESIAIKLRGMPPSATQELTKQGAINKLAGEIAQLQAIGYSINEIAQTLSSEGLVIAPATLKNYLQRARGGAQRKQRGSKDETPRVTRPKAPKTASVVVQRAATASAKSTEASKKASFTPSEDTTEI